MRCRRVVAASTARGSRLARTTGSGAGVVGSCCNRTTPGANGHVLRPRPMLRREHLELGEALTNHPERVLLEPSGKLRGSVEREHSFLRSPGRVEMARRVGVADARGEQLETLQQTLVDTRGPRASPASAAAAGAHTAPAAQSPDRSAPVAAHTRRDARLRHPGACEHTGSRRRSAEHRRPRSSRRIAGRADATARALPATALQAARTG